MSEVDENGEVKNAEWVSAGPTIDLHPRANLSPRQIVIEELEVAAVKLRDAELAWKQAGAEYREALDRFNAIVAPLPK